MPKNIPNIHEKEKPALRKCEIKAASDKNVTNLF